MSKPVKKEYAVYRGDELLAIGTAEDCAKKLKVTARYIGWLVTPTAAKRLAQVKDPNKRLTGIRLEDDEDE